MGTGELFALSRSLVSRSNDNLGLATNQGDYTTYMLFGETSVRTFTWLAESPLN